MIKHKEVYLGVRIDKETKEKYFKFCSDNTYSLSKRIRLFIEKDMQNKLKILE